MAGYRTSAGDPAADADDLDFLADGYAARARSVRTSCAYQADFRHFATWCERQGFEPLPATPRTVTLYLAAHAEALKPSTLSRRLVSIAQIHRKEGHESPTRADAVRTVYQGICRALGTAQSQVAPLLTDDVRAMVAQLPDSLAGHRDRALLLLGFAGAFRRSELVALDVSDLLATRAGLLVTVRQSKTDQAAAGTQKAIPHGRSATCPVAAYYTWIARAGIEDGAVFRPVDRHGNVEARRLTSHAVALVIKRTAEAVGLDPARYAGHSLRAGLATSAAMEGASAWDIKKTTGHKSDRTLARYIRDAELFTNNAATRAGL